MAYNPEELKTYLYSIVIDSQLKNQFNKLDMTDEDEIDLFAGVLYTLYDYGFGGDYLEREDPEMLEEMWEHLTELKERDPSVKSRLSKIDEIRQY